MTRRRLFSSSERAALWIDGDGRCVMCGDELSPGWHADHVQAFAGGGETDVINGQALCPACNLRKGDRVVLAGGWPNDWPLRAWQGAAYLEWLASGRTDFLLVATPGAGKTAFALRCAHQALADGWARRVLVVVPTDHLRGQWAKVAARVGLQLQDDFANRDGAEAGGFDGMVTTYASLATQPLVYRKQCASRPTFVILDEPHHMGDEMTWGRSARLGLEPSVRRLLISGTPWRDRGGMIPFTRYSDGLAQPDFTYDYPTAIVDRVCRPVMFPRFDGEMRWESTRGSMVASFTDEIPEDEASRRLRTALHPAGQWLPGVLAEAHQHLMQLRAEGHPSAGGLVQCSNQDHAREICGVLRRISGQEPVLAISDEPESRDRIERFVQSYDPWIVAVRMLSEGNDIPRLAEGVYATNVINFRSFMQFIGRFTRVQEGAEDIVSRINIPNDPTLTLYAAHVANEVDAGIEELIRRYDLDREDEPKQRRERSGPMVFSPGWSSDAEFVGVTTVDGDSIPRPVYDRAEALARDRGHTSRDWILYTAQILMEMGYVQAEASEPRAAAADSLNAQRRFLLGQRKSRTRQMGSLFVEATGNSRGYEYVSSRVKRLCGGVPPRQASLEQHERALAVLLAWLKSLRSAITEERVTAWVQEWEQGLHDGEYGRATAGAR